MWKTKLCRERWFQKGPCLCTLGSEGTETAALSPSCWQTEHRPGRKPKVNPRKRLAILCEFSVRELNGYYCDSSV